MKIKNIILLVSIFVLTNFETGCIFRTKIDDSISLLDEKGNPKPALLKLLDYYKVKHDGTAKEIIQITQKEWLRKPTQERWDLKAEKTPEIDETLQKIYKKIGTIDEISPKYKKYDYVFLMGALEQRMKLRIEHLIKLFNDGIRFDNIVFLAGERPREPLKEEMKEWNIKGELPKTEFEIIKYIFEHINLPKDLTKDVKLIYINAPMKKTVDGKLARPNTGDTINQLLKSNPEVAKGKVKILVISNNPYAGYQHWATKIYFPENVEIDTVGTESTEKNQAVLKDNIARWLYQENLAMEKLKNS